MNLKEAELVTEEFCNRDDTYNLCPGGKGGWGYVNGNRTIEERRRLFTPSLKRASEALSAKFQSDPEFRKRFAGSNHVRRAAWKKYRESPEYRPPEGWIHKKNHSQETIAKFRVIHSGANNSQFGTRWVSKDGQAIKVRSDLIDTYLDIGYNLGRK